MRPIWTGTKCDCTTFARRTRPNNTAEGNRFSHICTWCDGKIGVIRVIGRLLRRVKIQNPITAELERLKWLPCCQTKYGKHCGGACTCIVCEPDSHEREWEVEKGS